MGRGRAGDGHAATTHLQATAVLLGLLALQQQFLGPALQAAQLPLQQLQLPLQSRLLGHQRCILLGTKGS